LDQDSEKVYAAALNQAQFDPYTINGIPSTNPICHKTAVVKGSKGEIKVRFIDRCPDCQQRKIFFFFVINNFFFFVLFFLGDLGLTEEAFIAVAGELGTGQTNVEWHFI